MRRFLLAVVLLWATGLVAAPVPKALKKPRHMMPLAVGTKWEYQMPGAPNQIMEVREITAVEEKDGAVIATQKNGGLTQKFRADADTVAVIGSGGSEYKNPRVILRTGMKEGDTWDWDAGGYTETRTVGKAEKVSVPAGEYTAVPITYSTTLQRDNTITVWYADGVGLIRVDHDGEPSQVLKAFTPGHEREAKK